VPGQGERRKRLHRIARQLDPRPAKLPYYVMDPMPWEPENARAWWMVDAKGHLLCLGTNAVRAEIYLVELLRAQHAGQRLDVAKPS
jgi:hypothetical protein